MNLPLLTVKYLLSKVNNEQSKPLAIVDIDGQYWVRNDAFTRLSKSTDIGFNEEPQLPPYLSHVPLTDDKGAIFAYLVQSDTDQADPTNEQTFALPVDDKADQFLALNGLMAKMLLHQKLDPLLQHIADVVIDITEADNALILLVNETEEQLDVVVSAGEFSSRNLGAQRAYGKGFAGLAWSTKREQYMANSNELEATKGYWPPFSQLVAVPLMSSDTVIGVAVLSAPAHLSNFRSSTGLLKHLASLAGIAIINAKSREQAELELSRMRALREINKLMVDFSSAAELIQSVSRTLMHAMDISRAVYFMVEDDGITQHADVWIKKDGRIIRDKSIVDDILSEGLNGWCYRNNQPVYLPRNQEDDRESKRVSKWRKEANIGGTFCVPITSNDRVVGVVSISRNLTKRDLNENEKNLFLSICSQMSSALLNHELTLALRHRAFHDSLTELPNRYYFEKQLESLLETSADMTPGVVMFLDLDGFKSVNDSFGHRYGDELLIQVAKRIRSCLSEQHILARVGGDEFALIAPDLSDKLEAIGLAKQMINALADNIEIKQTSVSIGVTIGLSFYPQDGDSVDKLICNADEAMYRSKANGKGGVVCFEQTMAEDSQRRLKLESELKEAIRADQFELYYQPQVDTCSGNVSSVEALVRWHHPTRGLVSPKDFIPAAEEAGLINAIGLWVVNRAVNQLDTWRHGPFKNVRIAVNVAASQFLQKGFSQQLIALLDKHTVAASQLEIEVTESIVMNDIQPVVETLNELRSTGVRVAVDDFGTGYSSLSYLQDLPLDVLKIDRAFINRLENAENDQSVANTIVLLSNCLGLDTVAEGVETAAQFERVGILGCSLVQGFFFARPCPEHELLKAIESVEQRFEKRSVEMVS